MVGGGEGAFIGEVHRIAMRLDDCYELVAGAFSSTPEKARRSGEALHVSPKRNYPSYEAMAEAEAVLPENERIDLVVVVTPNFLHVPVVRTFLEAGFHVVCDKPLSASFEDALELREVVRRTGKIFALTHNYTGYPLVKEARARVRGGELGRILKIVAEYPQGWLATDLEASGQKQASWRTDPTKSGKTCCLGDIGSHAENLARYVTGLEIAELCADFTTYVPGRALEDDANLLLRFEGGAKGVLHASQISVGEENGLHLRVYGEKGSLSWKQEIPQELVLKMKDQPAQVLRPGNAYLSPEAQAASRLPPGHPEAFLEAFANLYRAVAEAVHDAAEGKAPPPAGYDFPDIDDGIAGMQFIETAVASAIEGAVWKPMISA
jgi:predicted dehydrogenase